MTSEHGVLALVADPGLRDEVDRVCAAVGLRVIHAKSVPALSRKGWSAAVAVLLDEPSARRCSAGALSRRAGVVLVSGAEPTDTGWSTAIAVGAQRFVTLPRQESELVAVLADAGESRRDDVAAGVVVAVIAGRGGAGASLFAVALAQVARQALLLDVDPWGGGIDLLLGSEDEPGLRWPELTLAAGRINLAAVREALPRYRGISVLSTARQGGSLNSGPDAGPLAAMIDAGRRGGATVICDLPRRLTGASESALDAADLVVVVTQCDVRSTAATAAMAPTLCAINPNVGLVVRGPAPSGLRAAEVAGIVALPLLATMRPEPRLAELLDRGGLRMRARSPLASAARQVLAVAHQHPVVDAA